MKRLLVVLFFCSILINIKTALATPATNPIVISEKGFQLSLANENIVILKHTGYKVKNVFDISKPNRLVIDIENLRFRKNYNIATANSKIFNKIRSGNHPNLARIVLDISSENMPNYETKDINEVLTITFLQEAVSANDKTIESPTEAMAETEKESVTETAHAIQTETETESVTTQGATIETPSSVTVTEKEDTSKTAKEIKTPATPSVTETTTKEENSPKTITEAKSATETIKELETPTEAIAETENTIEEEPSKTEEVSETITASETLVESKTTAVTPSENETTAATQSESETPTETETQSKTVTPSESETTAATQSESETTTESETQSETVTPSESETAAATQSESETTTETETATESATTALLLTHIDFDTASSAIVISVNKKTHFSLTKNSDIEYILNVPSCELKEKYLSLPYFPPQSFEGINLVQTDQKDDSLNIKIKVQPGVTLTALPVAKDILVKREI